MRMTQSVQSSFRQVDRRHKCNCVDVRALLQPRAKKLAGAIAGRALYDGRLDAAAALKLIRAPV